MFSPHSLPRFLVVAAATATTACAMTAARNAPPAAPTSVRPVFAAAMASHLGDLRGAVRPDRSDADIAALRNQGPAALNRLLAELDAAEPGPARDALAATIDRVAGQRYATVSRLYWYTDLDQARAAARAAQKPILSLRLLGRLDEDLSCANSRFFRTVLYSDARISALLRDRFVLHWSSERPVPRVTIDYGDGRRLERTVTGNSVHYVLDADGRPLDALPGMYAPAVFRAELMRSLELAGRVAGAGAAARRREIAAWHQARMDERNDAWRTLGTVPVLEGSRELLRQNDVDTALARAQRAAISKAIVEVAELRAIDVGADPGTIEDSVEVWASIGQRLFGLGEPVRPPRGGRPTDDNAMTEPPRAPRPVGLLDARSRALVLALVDAAPADPRVPRLDAAGHDALIARLEQAMVADSAQNEMILRQTIRFRFVSDPGVGFDDLNRWIYQIVFGTPADDPWLGLLPRTAYTALPGDGVVME